MADALLAEAGFVWYEISNWARLKEGENLPSPAIPDATYLTNVSRHNLAYWRDWNWWGDWTGRAFSSRKRALVESKASTCLCAAGKRRSAPS